MLATNPYALPLPLLPIPFLLLGLGSYYVTSAILQMTPLPERKAKLVSAVLTSIVLLGVVLQSIRQLSSKDFLILLALLVGITWYMRRLEV